MNGAHTRQRPDHCSTPVVYQGFREMDLDVNGRLAEAFVAPLLGVHLERALVIDCQNYGTSYPSFFRREAFDPGAYYVFVNRGDLGILPTQRERTKPRPPRCSVPTSVRHPNVMCTACSSYMYLRGINGLSRCLFDCPTLSALHALGQTSSGDSKNRIQTPYPEFAAADRIAIDACQLDDYVLCIAYALLLRAGVPHVEILSTDGRFAGATIPLPDIRLPFYLVVQTQHSTAAAPVYQSDLRQLRLDFDNVPNTNHRDLWERADPAWMEKSESYRTHARQKNDELNREELQRRWGRFKQGRAPGVDGAAGSADVAARYGGTEAPVGGDARSAYADPILQLRETMYQELSDEAARELAAEARISAQRGVAFDPAQYLLNCAGLEARPTMARARLAEVARSVGAGLPEAPV